MRDSLALASPAPNHYDTLMVMAAQAEMGIASPGPACTMRDYTLCRLPEWQQPPRTLWQFLGFVGHCRANIPNILLACDLRLRLDVQRSDIHLGKELGMYDSAVIGRAGERAVVDWLTSKGFSIQEWDTAAPGATDIDASSGTKRLLVQVKSAVMPSSPVCLSQPEILAIRSRAGMLQAEAWSAPPPLEANQLGIIAIKWHQLN